MKTIYIMLAVSFFVMCETAPTEVTKPAQELFDPPSPPPVCTHQVCAERPAYLFCEETWREHGCGKFRIQYEHHCDCDQWAPAQEIQKKPTLIQIQKDAG
jgi:hypothetical protein